MMFDIIRGDISGTGCKHVGFAVNTQGYNDEGFTGMVASCLDQLDIPDKEPIALVLMGSGPQSDKRKVLMHTQSRAALLTTGNPLSSTPSDYKVFDSMAQAFRLSHFFIDK